MTECLRDELVKLKRGVFHDGSAPQWVQSWTPKLAAETAKRLGIKATTLAQDPWRTLGCLPTVITAMKEGAATLAVLVHWLCGVCFLCVHVCRT